MTSDTRKVGSGFRLQAGCASYLRCSWWTGASNRSSRGAYGRSWTRSTFHQGRSGRYRPPGGRSARWSWPPSWRWPSLQHSERSPEAPAPACGVGGCRKRCIQSESNRHQACFHRHRRLLLLRRRPHRSSWRPRAQRRLPRRSLVTPPRRLPATSRLSPGKQSLPTRTRHRRRERPLRLHPTRSAAANRGE